MNTKQLLWYWTPVGIYAGIIWYFSSLSIVPQPPSIATISDKVKHILEFFLLAILLYRAIYHTVSVKYSYLLTILLTSIYGVIDEIHQGFIPGRIFSSLDMLADAVGAFCIMTIKVAKIIWKKVTIDISIPVPEKEE